MSRTVVGLTLAVAFSAASAVSGEAGPAPAETYRRLVRDGEGLLLLQTAIRVFRNPSGAEVTLVGVSHQAEPAYYESVFLSLRAHDVILYEVGSHGVEPAHLHPELQWLRRMVLVARKLSALTDQELLRSRMDGRWTPADVPPLELNALVQGLVAQSGPIVPAELRARIVRLERLASSNLTAEQRRSAAKEARNLLIQGTRDMDYAIRRMDPVQSRRSDAVIGALASQLAGGRRHVAVLYGHSHMAAISRWLLASRFQEVGTWWLDAFRLTD